MDSPERKKKAQPQITHHIISTGELFSLPLITPEGLKRQLEHHDRVVRMQEEEGVEPKYNWLPGVSAEDKAAMADILKRALEDRAKE